MKFLPSNFIKKFNLFLFSNAKSVKLKKGGMPQKSTGVDCLSWK